MACPATCYPVTVSGFVCVCDSCQPRSHIEGSHHILQAHWGWARTCEKTPTIPLCVTSVSPQGYYGCGGRGDRDGPSCGTPANSTLHRWRPLILLRVCVHVHRPLSNSMRYNHKWTLQMEVCMHGGRCTAFSVHDQFCNVATC